MLDNEEKAFDQVCCECPTIFTSECCGIEPNCPTFREALRVIEETKTNNLCDCGCMRPAGPFGLYSMACGPKAGR